MAEVDVAHHPELLEAFEVAVDRRDLEGSRGPLVARGDALGRQRSLRGEQGVEHVASRRRDAVPGCPERIDDLVDGLERLRLAERRKGHRRSAPTIMTA